jgi:N-acetylglucosaminyldiphosphoundecaprenol N-acetyl-beta-D-mannosaminyltransferase
MIDAGKHAVLGVRVDAVDYEASVARVVEAAEKQQPLAVSALAVHGVMTGALDTSHARRLNGLDLVVPDGQPVRWALRWLHAVDLPDRVYGPELMLRSAAALEARGLPVYLYGSRREVLDDLEQFLALRFPKLEVAGSSASRFERVSADDFKDLVGRIEASGARCLLLGLGCPRQEVFAFEARERLRMPVLAVGAAFEFHAGHRPQAPHWMQRNGLEWLYRLAEEPSRLWRRYLFLNPLYLAGLAIQRIAPGAFPPRMPDGSEPVEHYA